MFHHIVLIHILAFSSMSCFGYEKKMSTPISELGKQGAIFSLAPDGDVQINLIRYESCTTKVNKEFDVKMGEITKGFHMKCRELSLNDKTKHPIKQYRVNFLVKDHGYEGEETDIEDFQVKSCDERALKDTIIFSVTQRNKYTVLFKDSSSPRPICYQREIEVNDKKETLSVKRSKPKEIDCKNIPSFRNSPGPGVIVPNSWMDEGELYDVDIPEQFSHSLFRLQGSDKCEDCFITCKWVKKDKEEFGVADVYVFGVPIDRLYSTSCSQFSMQNSVWLHGITIPTQNDGKGRIKQIYVNFLFPDGDCKRRRYTYDEQFVEGNHFLRRLYLGRFQLYPTTCRTNKAKGFLRQIGYTTGVRRLFPRKN